MNVVHMNGLTLLPGIDYTTGKNLISFSVPPPMGAEIMYTEVVDVNTGATHVTRLQGNGSTYMFKLDTDFAERLAIHELFSEAIKHKDNPAVRDAINKLQVILELVKQDATVY